MKVELKMAILKSYSTQSDFAVRVGCHESKVSQIIRGRRLLKKEEYDVWASALNCDRSMFQAMCE